MPRLDGPGLYRELERRRPELRARVIFGQLAKYSTICLKSGSPMSLSCPPGRR
jgi:hypothetical protein